MGNAQDAMPFYKSVLAVQTVSLRSPPTVLWPNLLRFLQGQSLIALSIRYFDIFISPLQLTRVFPLDRPRCLLLLELSDECKESAMAGPQNHLLTQLAGLKSSNGNTTARSAKEQAGFVPAVSVVSGRKAVS